MTYETMSTVNAGTAWLVQRIRERDQHEPQHSVRARTYVPRHASKGRYDEATEQLVGAR